MSHLTAGATRALPSSSNTKGFCHSVNVSQIPTGVDPANVCCAPGEVDDLPNDNFRSRYPYETWEHCEVGATFGGRSFARAFPARHQRKRPDASGQEPEVEVFGEPFNQSEAFG